MNNPDYATPALRFARGASHFNLNPNRVVAVHRLAPSAGRPEGTRIISAFAVARECVTSYAVTTETLDVVLDRLEPFGLRLEEFEGPRGKSHIATARVYEINPRRDGTLQGSFLKLAVGDGVYWPCSVLAAPRDVANALGVDL